jgi:hypothetical protein
VECGPLLHVHHVLEYVAVGSIPEPFGPSIQRQCNWTYYIPDDGLGE